MWYLKMSIEDIENTDKKELEWLSGRMCEQIKKENDALQGK